MGNSGVMTGVFLQARLSSSRLPEKALLPLIDKTVIEHAMSALIKINAPFHVLLTDYESENVLRPLAHGCGFRLYAGPRDDVLARYAGAAIRYGVRRVIRATGDNPLVSWHLAEDLLKFHQTRQCQFSGYLGPPLGTGVEIVETTALLEANDAAVDPYEREHVNPFLYRRPETYRVEYPEAPEECCYSEARVTLDTWEDYYYLQRLFGELYQGEPIHTAELVKWLRNDARIQNQHGRVSLKVG